MTGGIGAYKAVEVCRGLQKRGHDVVAVMTRSATKFVGPLTFEAITRHPVITSQFGSRPDTGSSSRDIEHIAIADRAALLLVAPCTANVLAKFAHGLADDFLSSLFLATKAPVLLAPAMNTNMLAHPAVQENLRTLAATRRAVRRARRGLPGLRLDGQGPPGRARGHRRGGGAGAGAGGVAAARPARADHGRSHLRGHRPRALRRQPLQRPDGFALAEEAMRRGAEVTLVAGPTSVPLPAAQQVVRVRSAAEMHEAVMARAAEADVVIMAAAVADYTLQAKAGQKMPKGDEPLSLTLTRTKDILAELGSMRAAMGGRRPVLVGFAAETDDVVRKARDKRARKGVDLVVANDVSQSDRGFDATTNAVTVVAASGETVVPLQAKSGVAAAILDAVEPLVGAAGAGRHTVKDQLAAHLEFFAELGVEGLRRESAWRTRATPDATLAAMPGPALAPVPPPVEPAPAPLGTRGAGGELLLELKAEIGPDCTRCKLHTLGRKQVVFGVGSPTADLMFVGEAPGADEDVAGRAVRRQGRAAADEDHRGDRVAARGRLHRQRDQVPAAGQPQPRAGRGGGVRAVPVPPDRRGAAEGDRRPGQVRRAVPAEDRRRRSRGCGAARCSIARRC